MESYATSENECSPAQESAAAPIEILIPDDAKSSESPEETKSKSMPTKLYVGNLSAGTNRKDLREMFQIYGQVSDVDVVGSFAFVVMPNEAEAEEAIKALHDKKIGGKILIVEKKKQRAAAPARKADRARGHRDIQLFAARCKDISEEQLTEVFQRFGSVVSVKKPRTKPDIAFIAMEHFFQARKAVEALNRRRSVEGLAQPIFVQLSTNNVGRDGRPLTDLLERGETIKLFVGNLDAETDATELGVLFERYGPVAVAFVVFFRIPKHPEKNQFTSSDTGRSSTSPLSRARASASSTCCPESQPTTPSEDSTEPTSRRKTSPSVIPSRRE